MASESNQKEEDAKVVSEQIRGRVEYWKQIVNMQIHFNDLCIRTRWLGLTAIATLVGAAAVTTKENITFTLPLSCFPIVSLPMVLLAISLIVLGALYYLDKKYYYKMLIVSVTYNENFEKQVMQDLKIENQGIGNAISNAVSRRRAARAANMFYFLTALVITIPFLILLFGRANAGW